MTEFLAVLRGQAPLFEGGRTPLGLDEFQQFTTNTDRNPNVGIAGLGFVLLGLYGEVGSLLSELKKKQRDTDSYVAYSDSVREELGDALWYFANAALRANIPLSVIARRCSVTLGDWIYHGIADATSFRELQREKTNFEGPLQGELIERRLLTLAAKVGLLVEDFTSGRLEGNGDALSADLVEIFRALIAVADDADVSLDQAALSNLEKTHSRWPLTKKWSQPFDELFPLDEQFPRRIEMVFKEREVAGKLYVFQQCNGINVGDRLTDNRTPEDDYRFHDVFHLSYLAILGWSPVMRSLFKLKRKSDPTVDENEDGARAGLIEEGIATFVFNHAQQVQFYRSVSSVDYSLLKTIQQLVHGYEVETRRLWQWEEAILQGFEVFRALREHRNGTVVADLSSHSITFVRDA